MKLIVTFLFILDDPYYCGLRARVPNFVKTKTKGDPVPSKRFSVSQGPAPGPASQRHMGPMGMHSGPMPGGPIHHHHHPMHPQNPAMWHARSYESGIGVYKRFSKLLENNSWLPRQQPHSQDKRLLHQPRKS